MKKPMFSLSGLLCIVLAGCNDKSSGPSATAQKNLDATKNIRQAIANKDMAKLGDYIATDCIDHSGDSWRYKRDLDSIKAQRFRFGEQWLMKKRIYGKKSWRIEDYVCHELAASYGKSI